MAIGTFGAFTQARLAIYAAQTGQPLYTVLPDGSVSDGSAEEPGCHSVLREYKFKLERIYDRFLTRRGSEMAQARRENAAQIYRDVLQEAREAYDAGGQALRSCIESD